LRCGIQPVVVLWRVFQSRSPRRATASALTLKVTDATPAVINVQCHRALGTGPCGVGQTGAEGCCCKTCLFRVTPHARCPKLLHRRFRTSRELRMLGGFVIPVDANGIVTRRPRPELNPPSTLRARSPARLRRTTAHRLRSLSDTSRAAANDPMLPGSRSNWTP
jgi:hypothetical protein